MVNDVRLTSVGKFLAAFLQAVLSWQRSSLLRSTAEYVDRMGDRERGRASKRGNPSRDAGRGWKAHHEPYFFVKASACWTSRRRMVPTAIELKRLGRYSKPQTPASAS